MATYINNEIIGIDLGKTIFDVAKRQPFPDALEVVGRLRQRFGDNIHIVSKVTPEQQVRAEAFVTSASFVNITGIPIERVHFCAERHEKAPIAKKLGLTHFIDDRPEVAFHMRQVVPHLFIFRPTPEDIKKFGPQLLSAVRVDSWQQIERILLT